MNHRDDSEPTPAPAKFLPFITYFNMFGLDKHLKKEFQMDFDEEARWYEKPKAIKCPECNLEQILYVCTDITCINNNNRYSFFCYDCMCVGKNHSHFPIIKVCRAINIMIKIVENDISFIKSVNERARELFHKFERFTMFLENEVIRI